MTLHILGESTEPTLATALAEFETQFSYPLGPGRTFRISHGEDYARFFRAMGEGVSLTITEQRHVLGTLGMAIRQLMLPNGEEQSVVYLGDLKVAPAARKSMVFLQLAWAAENWARGKANIGFGVVMDGTPVAPDTYTGRIGIPAGRVLGKVQVWRLPCENAEPVLNKFESEEASKPTDCNPWAFSQSAGSDRAFLSDREAVYACFRKLSRGRYASIGGQPELRSEMDLVWLLHPSRRACGLVEDTRRAKRLWADDGSEIRSAHLSYFAFSSATDAVELLDVAKRQAGQVGHPALFVSIAGTDHPSLSEAMGHTERIVAPATVYGHGLDDGMIWNINTAEI